MANIKINQIELTGSLTSGDSFIVLDEETQATKRASLSTISEYASNNSYFLAVADSQSRDSIDVSARKEGMHVTTLDDQKTYRLIGSDLSDNSNWVEIAGFTPAYITSVTETPSWNNTYVSKTVYFDIYIEKEENGGSDVTGDGTQESPFSSLAKAFEKIPSTNPWIDANYIVNIYMGPGEFLVSDDNDRYIRNLGKDGTVSIRIHGSLNELETINVTDVSNTTVAGKYASKMITCDNFSTQIDQDGKYFINFGSSLTSYLCRSSISPQIEMLGYPSLGEAKIVTLATSIRSAYGCTLGYQNIALYHLNFIQDGFIPTITKAYSCTFNGWAIQAQGKESYTSYCYFGPPLPETGGTVSQIDVGGGDGYNIFNQCVFDDMDLLWRGSPEWCSIQYSVLKNNSRIWISEYGDPSYLHCRTLDFENCALCFDIQNQNSYVLNDGNISVENCEILIKVNYNAMFRSRGTRTISGTTTSTPIQILDGGTVLNVKVACDGKLTNTTNPGQDIIVGQNKSPISFASLPATDLDTFSRAN